MSETEKNDVKVATRRTTQNATVLSVVTAIVVYLFNRFSPFGYDIDPGNPYVLIAVPFIVGIGYRASRELDARFPWIGRVLFGNDTDPEYISEG